MERKKSFQTLIGNIALMLLGSLLLGYLLIVSITTGAGDISYRQVLTALFFYDSELESHNIIQELRVPRALAGTLIGASLAVAGCIMQGMTRNALASPSIMGITDGAAFGIAFSMAFLPPLDSISLMVAAFIGAGIGAFLVFGVASLSRGGVSPVKLALAGVAVGAMLSAFSSGIAIHFNIAQEVNFWYAGHLSGIRWHDVTLFLPLSTAGILVAIILSRSVTLLSLGNEVAVGLGQRTLFIKITCTIIVLILTGAAVATAGSIGFIGLVIPHIARLIVGQDYRYIIPVSAVLGASLLTVSDIGARLVNPPFETPVGAITALIGVPFFLFLARREGRGLD
ncbi:FecCD family ABC transporter permease [Marinococcus luteus]|uniref:FecCD family ABC transporter permease n=1 Tax=Marinococcus luteus TaxID=1122204 RepID=UPI002ACC69CC|nr:iron ABC transporter permease [Marinococcus luteus]MDZ5783132.1 iron ABC transporter permease [Marinococcus luteus]